jgi:predicted metalloendopeptidase
VTTLALPLVAALVTAPVPPVGLPIDPARMDPTVPACEDFYQHAVGGWLKANPIPPDKGRYGAFDQLVDRNQEILRTILEETSARRDWPKGSNEQKVGDFFASGMDQAAIEKAGAKPLQPWLRRVDALKRPADLAGFLAQAHLSDVGGGFDFGVDQDEKNSTRYIPVLHQGGLGLPDRDYYLNDDARSKELREKYLGAVAQLLELAGEPAKQARADAATVLAFETKLARASRTRVALRDPEKNYNLRTLAELESEAPGFGWGPYLGQLGIPRDQAMNVGQPEFLQAFADLAAHEPIATWRTYLRWQIIRSAAPLLSKKFEEAHFAFYGTALRGVPQQQDRWKRVLGQIDPPWNAGLGEALGQLYVERAFPPQAKQRMLDLVENLRTALRARIEALPWMSGETKQAALAKLTALGVKVGYPDRWRDFSALTVKRQGYLENVFALRAFESRRQLAKLGRPIDRGEWGLSPPTVNAYYNPNKNEIVFPAGILQPPFFWADADDAVNYGAIGVVIGHEMTHGFDDQGSQYDAEGNLRNWWTEADRKAYTERTGLMVKQFDGYRPFLDAAINGQLTLGENIADLGGIKVAWAALKQALGRDPNAAPPLDGFTPGQRFFLSFATIWENNIREQQARMALTVDPHSPGKWRVLGPLSNLPEFHAAFDCHEGSPMNRPVAERPEIW